MNTRSDAFVAIDALTKRFGSETAVNDVSLAIGEGEFVTLLGPSGCGKTTTLRCIAGLERPDGGTIQIGGKLVASSDGVYLAPEQRDIGMVFQSYAVWPHMTVFENVAYGLHVRRVGTSDVKRRTLEALELVGLAHLAQRYATKLSGGQKQRVALARAIVYRPKVVLFDEPLSNLDAKLREQMRVELARLQRDVGVTSIYVTHDQAEALVMSDRIVVMNDGTVQQIGDPQTIYWRPANTFVARFIGLANLIEATVLGRDARACDVEIPMRPGEQPLRLRIACNEPLACGSRIQLCLRPEDVALHTTIPSQTDGLNVLHGDVLGTAFLGTYVECRVGVGPHEFCARSTDAGEVRPGQQVIVTFDPAHAIRVV